MELTRACNSLAPVEVGIETAEGEGEEEVLSLFHRNY